MIFTFSIKHSKSTYWTSKTNGEMDVNKVFWHQSNLVISESANGDFILALGYSFPTMSAKASHSIFPRLSHVLGRTKLVTNWFCHYDIALKDMIVEVRSPFFKIIIIINFNKWETINFLKNISIIIILRFFNNIIKEYLIDVR